MEHAPALESRCQTFERHLLVERGLSKTTAKMRVLLVRMGLREWNTLNPTKEHVQRLKETYILDGYHRDYVGNICLSFRDYGAFIGVDLKVKPPSPEPTRVPRFMTEPPLGEVVPAVTVTEAFGPKWSSPFESRFH